MPLIGQGQVQSSDPLLRTAMQDATTSPSARVRVAPAEFGPYIAAGYADEPQTILPAEFTAPTQQTKAPINWTLILGIASLLLLGN